MAILYPVAATADAALHSPLGFAAREREAEFTAKADVEFITQAVGPAFTTREAALDAYAGKVDDERPGRISVALEARWCELRAVSTPLGVKPRLRAPLQPEHRDGRRAGNLARCAHIGARIGSTAAPSLPNDASVLGAGRIGWNLERQEHVPENRLVLGH